MPWSRAGLSVVVTFVLTGLLLNGCRGESPVGPTTRAAKLVASGNVVPYGPTEQQQCDVGECSGGGDPIDPGPTPAEVSLDGITMDACRNRQVSGQDSDSDLLDDDCEYRLAYNFRPVMRFNSNDGNTVRESFWMAHRIYGCNSYYYNGVSATCLGTWEVVRIAYLLGYRNDTGFNGHNGDSEFIIVEARYDATSDSWFTSRAYMPAHWGVSNPPADKSRWWYSSELQFPGLSYGSPAPRAWVSVSKHANYATQSACNAGSWLFNDTCEGNALEEGAEVRRERNVGESTSRLIDAVTAPQPVYLGTEWFWCYSSGFCGWHTDRSDCASPYSQILSAMMSNPNGYDYQAL